MARSVSWVLVALGLLTLACGAYLWASHEAQRRREARKRQEAVELFIQRAGYPHYALLTSFHSGMEDSVRDALVEKHLLRTTSPGLDVELAANRVAGGGTLRIAFVLTLRNTSSETVSISRLPFYAAEALFFRSSQGHFLISWETVKYSLGECQRDWLRVLRPGEQAQITVACCPRWVDTKDWMPYIGRGAQDNLAPRTLVLESSDMLQHLGAPGTFTVYAVYAADRAKSWAEKLGLPPVWEGRAVSKPIEIEIKPEDVPVGALPKTRVPSGG